MSVERPCLMSDCWRRKHYLCPGRVNARATPDDDVQPGDTWKCCCSCHLVHEAVERNKKRLEELEREAKAQDGSVYDVAVGDAGVGVVEPVAPGQMAGTRVLVDVEGGEGVADQVVEGMALVDADLGPVTVEGDEDD